MIEHGFLRVAAAVPVLRVADCDFNAGQILGLLRRAEGEGVQVLVFPELALTGYTCADLFQQPVLQQGARRALRHLVAESAALFSGLAIVGLPLMIGDQLFNVAAVFHSGQLLGVVPKSYLPNYQEFYEDRWFTPAAAARHDLTQVDFGDTSSHFGTRQLFAAAGDEGVALGVEICEDLWVPVPPSCQQALQGATVLVNLSGSNETIGKAAYRRQLVVNQSARCLAAYVYAGCGVHESTTDLVFGGHCLIAENGTLLAESERFRRDETLLVADIDLEHLRGERQRTNSFQNNRRDRGSAEGWRRTPFSLDVRPAPVSLKRPLDPHPFVPRGEEELRERCREIFQIQVAGLAKRLEHIGKPAVAIGISGGLDSTLALLVACKTMDILAVPRDRIRAVTMPGFGTTTRTHANATDLMRQLGVMAREVDIRALSLEQMRALKHRPFGIDLEGMALDALAVGLAKVPASECHDLVFENVQARLRTSILMNAGFVIGTGDVSELALGWATYNGDHMSMYNPNVSIPKTLVKSLVRWAARHEFDGDARRTLLDIVETKISPELLPTDGDGAAVQETEASIGPYELHDFFLFHFLRHRTPPAKILYLARQAVFDRAYSDEELRRWLRVFLQRFFANQFKRSCLPDGPKVGSISLSPRGDWRMPSDAQAELWLRETE